MHPLVHISHVGFQRLDVGWGFTNRSDPFWRLYHDFDPGAAIDAAEGRVSLDPSNVVLVPAGSVFSAVPPRTPIRHLYVHFTLTAPDRRLPEHPFAIPVEAGLKALLGDGSDADRNTGDPLRACALVYHALALAQASRLPQAAGDFAIRYIRENLHSRLTVNRLAHRDGVTADHFIRRFARRYGTTPARYIASERLALASHLLTSTDLPLEELARRCGFASRGHLGTAFKRATGTTPAEHRAAAGTERRRGRRSP